MCWLRLLRVLCTGGGGLVVYFWLTVASGVWCWPSSGRTDAEECSATHAVVELRDAPGGKHVRL